MTWPHNEGTSHRVDILVLTATSTEYKWLCKVFGVAQSSEVLATRNRKLYKLAAVRSYSSSRTLTIALANLKRMGNSDSASLTTEFVADLQPSVALLSGTCGGRSGKANPGDVLIASALVDYEAGVSKDGRVSGRGFDLTPEPWLLDQAAKVTDDSSAWSAAQRSFLKGEDLPNSPLKTIGEGGEFGRLQVGALASGEKLWMSGLERLASAHGGQIVGIEMEGIGFAKACRNAMIPWLIAKGVTDLATSESRESRSLPARRAQAAAASAVFVKLMVQMLDMSPPSLTSTGMDPKAGEEKRVVQQVLGENDVGIPLSSSEQAESLWRAGNHREAISYAREESRRLLLSGKLDERLRLGRILASMAMQMEPPDQIAWVEAKIDLIGWTLALGGHYQSAISQVQSGLGSIKESNQHALKARALRHLAGIALLGTPGPSPSEALKRLDEAEAEGNKIKDRTTRLEMIGDIRLGRCDADLLRAKPDEAEEQLRLAENDFRRIGDSGRLAKTYSRRGRIAEVRKDQALAADYYLRGLVECAKEYRFDEAIINSARVLHLLVASTSQCNVDSALERARRYSEGMDWDWLRHLSWERLIL